MSWLLWSGDTPSKTQGSLLYLHSQIIPGGDHEGCWGSSLNWKVTMHFPFYGSGPNSFFFLIESPRDTQFQNFWWQNFSHVMFQHPSLQYPSLLQCLYISHHPCPPISPLQIASVTDISIFLPFYNLSLNEHKIQFIQKYESFTLEILNSYNRHINK